MHHPVENLLHVGDLDVHENEHIWFLEAANKAWAFVAYLMNAAFDKPSGLRYTRCFQEARSRDETSHRSGDY